MTALVLRGDARSLPLPDESVDLICTSPPYWGLRDYRDGGKSLAGQIGSEETPREWLETLLDCTQEWMRVLKPDGSMFVDLGDKYSTRADGSAKRSGRRDHAGCLPPMRNSRSMGRPKSLLLLPERYRIGCVDRLGLIARARIVWSKPSPLPESARDRAQNTHEDIVHLVKQPRYFSAVDEIRVPHTGGTHARRKDGRLSPKEAAAVAAGLRNGFYPKDTENPLGKLPGSVWEIASVPLAVPAHLEADHFAAYPPELCRRIILGWSPHGICTECGHGRRPVASAVRTFDGEPRHDLPAWAASSAPRRPPNGAGHGRYETKRNLIGYACACSRPAAPTRSAVVLDPFGGTGTTALTADVLGRTGITADLSADYCRIARWRISDPAERARAMQVPKPPPVPDGQGSLFDPSEVAS